MTVILVEGFDGEDVPAVRHAASKVLPGNDTTIPLRRLAIRIEQEYTAMTKRTIMLAVARRDKSWVVKAASASEDSLE